MLTSEQVASSGCNNFTFFNRRASIESAAELADYLTGSLLATRQDIAAGRLVYDPTVTYMSLIVGDGDNIAFMKGGRRGWMEERVSYCQSKGECSVQVIMTGCAVEGPLHHSGEEGLCLQAARVAGDQP